MYVCSFVFVFSYVCLFFCTCVQLCVFVHLYFVWIRLFVRLYFVWIRLFFRLYFVQLNVDKGHSDFFSTNVEPTSGVSPAKLARTKIISKTIVM
jgi:hypothetical protein